MVAAATQPYPVARSIPRALDWLIPNHEVAFWLLQAAGWSTYFIGNYFVFTLYQSEAQPEEISGYLQVVVCAATSGLVLSSLLRYAYRLVRDQKPIVVVPAILALVYPTAVLWRMCITASYVVYMHEWSMLQETLPQLLARALSSTYLLLCWSALYFGIYYYESVQREREATLRATALARETQVKMLRYQLNPHFLFNTLNAISTLILDRDTERANLAVTRLSAFLRHTLDQDPMKKVTLKQELEALDLYLGIEKLRFGPRLRLQFDVDPAALGALVPSLLLQPLIENALKYAIAPAEAGGTLHVGARVIGQRLLLHVADDGPGLAPGASVGGGRGVGLRNTQERLLVLYGDRARFAHHNTRPGLRIDIEFPAELVA
ncbi:MAG TPA: histidine kinase [Steroidobacteraceae bacterium]|nr:histidine kinase [Steroidobacteraceae bacterium]